MATKSPDYAVRVALASYLDAALKATTGLADSEAIGYWVEPTKDLQLSPTRVVVSIIPSGAPRYDDHFGDARVSRILPGLTGNDVILRWRYGHVAQDLTIGVWACAEELRADVDYLISGFLNAPYWSTVAPVANTTVSAAIVAGPQTVTPANIADIWEGCTLKVDGGEAVTVETVSYTTFKATFRLPHAGGAHLVEVPGRRETLAAGLHLRAPAHFNNVARYDFDGAQALATPESAVQQSWRSIRNGAGRIVEMTDTTAHGQAHLYLSGQVGRAEIDALALTAPAVRQVF